jgi:PAS domain S-box-containing protein
MKMLIQTMRVRSRGRRQSDVALAFLASLAGEFSVVLGLPELLDRVLRMCHEELGFDSCTIALIDESNHDDLRILAASGLRSTYRDLAIPAGKGLHGEVIRTGLPLLVPDMAADPRIFQRQPNICSGIYTPLAVRNRVLGVLSAHRAARDAFTSAELDLLTVVAGYVASAVEVARLHERLKEQALNATHQLTDVLDALSVPMIITSLADGMILRWNRAAAEVYGYTQAEIVGLPVFMLEPPDRPRTIADVLAAIREGEPVRSVDTMHLGKNGRDQRLTLTAYPMRNVEGKVRWALLNVAPARA